MRGLLLVLFLASLSLYVLGIASLVAASRLAQLPTETPVVSVVQQTVLVIVTQAAREDTPVPTATPDLPTTPFVLVRASPAPTGLTSPTATLEPTPTQMRNLPKIVAPPEPSVASIRTPVVLSPVFTPGLVIVTPVRPPGSPTVNAAATAAARLTGLPGLRPVGTPLATPTPRVLLNPGDADELPSPTASVRLGIPTPLGTPLPGAPSPGTIPAPPASPTPAPPAATATVAPGKPAASTATSTVRR